MWELNQKIQLKSKLITCEAESPASKIISFKRNVIVELGKMIGYFDFVCLIKVAQINCSSPQGMVKLSLSLVICALVCYAEWSPVL